LSGVDADTSLARMSEELSFL